MKRTCKRQQTVHIRRSIHRRPSSEAVDIQTILEKPNIPLRSVYMETVRALIKSRIYDLAVSSEGKKEDGAFGREVNAALMG